jgi:RNA polymerase sigma-B factor
MNQRQDESRPDRDRTRELLARFAAARDAGDAEADALREDLVVAYLNLVRFLAHKFGNRGEPLDDIVQVGTVGLLKAIDRFDPARGIEFTTYATPTIVGEIKRYFRDKGWAVKVPRRLQELNLAVNRANERMTVELGRSPTVSELAAHLGASEEEILEALELGQAYNLLSLDSELAGDDRRSQTLADTVGATDAELDLFEDRSNLEAAMRALTGRERVIIHLRFFEMVSQTEIAKRLNVSQMHVSRLQARALEKMRAALDDN